MQYIADCSLSLINRTGAHFVVRAIVEGLPDRFSAIRHWRTYSGLPTNSIVRKLSGRLMLKEIELLKDFERLHWPVPARLASLPVLYMDPLYVTRNQLREQDIVLCHDVGPLSKPEFFDPPVRLLYRRAYDRIRSVRPGIIFVSEATKVEYLRVVGGGARFMAPVPLFLRDQVEFGEPEPVTGLSSPFFLCVAASEKRKNLPLAVRAFDKSGLAGQGYRFVICGARGNDAENVRAAVARTPNVVQLDYVTDAQLRWLYRTATAFVLPSLLEGFGMPALEAVSHGLLPIVPKGGALEEATGGYGLFVDPESVDSVANAMEMATTAGALPDGETSWRSRPAVKTRQAYLREIDAILNSDRP